MNSTLQLFPNEFTGASSRLKAKDIELKGNERADISSHTTLNNSSFDYSIRRIDDIQLLLD